MGDCEEIECDAFHDHHTDNEDYEMMLLGQLELPTTSFCRTVQTQTEVQPSESTASVFTNATRTKGPNALPVSTPLTHQQVCDACGKKYEGDCPEHGTLTIIPNNDVPVTCKLGRVARISPSVRAFAKSSLPDAGIGVFTRQDLPGNVRLRSFHGKNCYQPHSRGLSWTGVDARVRLCQQQSPGFQPTQMVSNPRIPVDPYDLLMQRPTFPVCDACGKKYEGDCPEHGTLTIIPNNDVPVTCKLGRVARISPTVRAFAKSSLPDAGIGVLTRQDLPGNVRLGSFHGNNCYQPDSRDLSWTGVDARVRLCQQQSPGFQPTQMVSNPRIPVDPYDLLMQRPPFLGRRYSLDKQMGGFSQASARDFREEIPEGPGLVEVEGVNAALGDLVEDEDQLLDVLGADLNVLEFTVHELGMLGWGEIIFNEERSEEEMLWPLLQQEQPLLLEDLLEQEIPGPSTGAITGTVTAPGTSDTPAPQAASLTALSDADFERIIADLLGTCTPQAGVSPHSITGPGRRPSYHSPAQSPQWQQAPPTPHTITPPEPALRIPLFNMMPTPPVPPEVIVTEEDHPEICQPPGPVDVRELAQLLEPRSHPTAQVLQD